MKKQLPLMLTLLAGALLGAGVVLVVLRFSRPQLPGGGAVEEAAEGKAAGREQVAVGEAQFDVSGGAAAGYVDDRACAACHRELYEAYQQVGMARSFARPSSETLVEDFENSKFFHQASQRHYEMVRQGDELMFRRYQLDQEDQRINEFACRVDWMLGSGNHARNYLHQTEAGELFQLPVAWYGQEKRWAMAAGFDNGRHDGVQRHVSRECMFCHNAYPDVPAGSDAYGTSHVFPRSLPQGIGCQRCHGPGAQHVREAAADPQGGQRHRQSIVNPSRLDAPLRDDVCNQCHLQPTFVSMNLRRFGVGDYAFRPGQSLDEYLALLDVSERERPRRDRFEINHHAYRLQQSKCFTQSEERLSCVTCHDPHHRLAAADRAAHYRKACLTCHEGSDCRVDPAAPHAEGVNLEDCATCHMPRRRAQDVVHVALTDHRIGNIMPAPEFVAPLAESTPQLVDAELLPRARLGNKDLDALYRAVGMLRMSNFSFGEAADQAENLLVTLNVQQVEPYLDLIAGQLKQRRYAAAARTASAVLEKHPQHALAHQWRAAALLGLKQNEQAAGHFSQALASDPDHAETHYNLGLLLLGHGDAAGAAQHLQRAVDVRPHLVLAWYYLGKAQQELGQPDRAVQTFQRALEIEPSHTRSYVELGQTLAALGRGEQAQRVWRHGSRVAAQPRVIIAALQQAQMEVIKPILSEVGEGAKLAAPRATLVDVPIPQLERLEASVADQVRQLLDTFSQVAAQPTTSATDLAEAYGTLGQLFHAYEMSDAAERCYVNAIRLAPQDDRSYHMLAALYQQVGQLSAAREYFQRALTLRTGNVAAAVRLGTILVEQNQLDQASQQFQQALAQDPACAAAHHGLGEVALAEKKYQQAVSHFEEALRLVPEANLIHYSLAMAYRGLGQTDKAEEHLAKRGTVGIRPADPLVDALPQLLQGERVYLIRGRLAFAAGRIAEAAEAFAAAVQANPDSATAAVNYASALAQLGKTEEALAQNRRALELEPDNLTAHFNLGNLMIQEGNFEQAIEHFRTVTKKNPRDLAARRKLAAAQNKAGRTAEAVTQLESLLEDAPDDELGLLDLADLLVETPDYPRALEVLGRANQQFPDRGATAHALARLLATCPDLALRDGKRAVELAQRVAAAHQSIRHVETLALALAEADRCEEAAALQKQLLGEAQKLADEAMIERFQKALLRYEKGSPCRPPGGEATTSGEARE